MSAIVTTYDNAAAMAQSAVSPLVTTYTGDTGFSDILDSQIQSATPAPAPGEVSDPAGLQLTTYSPGQQTVYALSQAGEGATASTGEAEAAAETEAAESSETTEAGGAGWPGEGTTMAEWIPNGMQFYDELTGQWVEDNIPHRINENGDLEYSWEGEWFLDTAVRHRMITDGEVVETGEEVAAAEGEESAEGEEAALTTTLDSEGPFEVEYYYNADLGQWKIFNFPTRENEDGSREYYWQDQWWTDQWDHNYTA